jgi:hypothetical protein
VDRTAIGYGLITLLFGVFIFVERNSFARDNARWQRWLWSRWQRWLGINLAGHFGREERQKRYIVAMGVVLMVLGVGMILIGIIR